MRITYDREVDALYIRFTDEPVQVITQRLTEDVAVNYSPEGRIVGIEVLDASSDELQQNLKEVLELCLEEYGGAHGHE